AGGAHVTSSGRSQSGGLGNQTGRSIMRTMPRRKVLPAEYCWQRRALVGGDSGTKRGSLASRCVRATGQHLEPTGGWSTARLESYGRESREGPVGRRGAPAQRRRGV